MSQHRILTPVAEVHPALWCDYSTHKTLTCQNHQGSRYLTKGNGRGLHFVQADPSINTECDCPYADLRLVTSLKKHSAFELA